MIEGLTIVAIMLVTMELSNWVRYIYLIHVMGKADKDE